MRPHRSTYLRLFTTSCALGAYFLLSVLPQCGQAQEESSDQSGSPPHAIGFEAADANADSQIDRQELREYLSVRLESDELPFNRIFKRLDEDGNKSFSSVEFDQRHDVLRDILDESFFETAFVPADPGVGYQFFTRSGAIDDRMVYGASYHRYMEALADGEAPQIAVDSAPIVAPESISAEVFAAPSNADLESAFAATLVICGGGNEMFTSGGVVISPQGLVLTNYHVAEAMRDNLLVGFTNDGQLHRFVEFIAGDRLRDVAILRLKGSNFAWAPVAIPTTTAGQDIVMLHHSENRFFTYDRGYIMRKPMLGENIWMEISCDYAPGGSGCGIFNSQHELIGLVSMIAYGDGPTLADIDMAAIADEEDDWESEEESLEEGILLVKHAVGQESLFSILNFSNSDFAQEP